LYQYPVIFEDDKPKLQCCQDFTMLPSKFIFLAYTVYARPPALIKSLAGPIRHIVAQSKGQLNWLQTALGTNAAYTENLANGAFNQEQHPEPATSQSSL
jgi:hypothetical protein